MLKFKSLKTILVALTLCVTISSPAFAGSYTVVSGDSLYKIGQVFNTSSNNLMKTNNINEITIYPGQVLKVPCSTYTVKSGDSLYLISKRYGISLYNLRRANNKWDNNIYPGQILNLPGISPSSGTSQNSNLSITTSSVPITQKPVISYTEADLDLLSRLVTAEAQNQPYSAQVGVAAVVINRVQSSEFPNNISSVIYQKINGYAQFTPVVNGWINKPSTDTAKKAAKEALYGSDPSKGALFYFDDSATNTWLWSKPILARIGNMVFVK
ncbi:spore germination cell wall hydrolase CwlJ-like protein [Clostridium tetanomorphum]|uniref:LysM peptidoglycan-binding domain-containing protein n=1 Tax=Clostridium tetanomorphum TaxID=1553 RepID=A0A923EBS7_CLOTT|nr:cell wall hydrolase [Clostridium tetanomorphum]KAJ53573.1 cell wall hydrolase [Clostridium tetanomorphum DSM 665]MBC2398054.1 LysM peptidoglycan-binding domain-containing protein [Clostridium tetanomorphum]MBP1864620.1 spore germination cell wall hydrolase CwlJ-like protein [Clostridium tetanomorphum]NRS84089.1 spore germination cell wall hydrolase CwlJ-like protein [Clostridium tetanomorphum]NRZ97303.1 spore germination cell wall hydrolase CwlJ-like protein [Clostridium tetanomorphum]